MSRNEILIEGAFFVLGILPWWYIAYMRDKTLPYWILYVFVCLVWLPYYTFVHFAPMGMLNNAVESGIAVYGLYRITRPRRSTGNQLNYVNPEPGPRLSLRYRMGARLRLWWKNSRCVDFVITWAWLYWIFIWSLIEIIGLLPDFDHRYDPHRPRPPVPNLPGPGEEW